MMMAEAAPPPLQIAAMPYLPPLRCNTLFKVETMRAPDAPNGKSNAVFQREYSIEILRKVVNSLQ